MCVCVHACHKVPVFKLNAKKIHEKTVQISYHHLAAVLRIAMVCGPNRIDGQIIGGNLCIFLLPNDYEIFEQVGLGNNLPHSFNNI